MSDNAKNEVVLRAKGVCAAYGKRQVLRDFGLQVRPGEVVALLGLNGAGKSTALKALAGVIPLQKGAVWLDGQNVSALPAHIRARLGMGYVMQGGQVFPSLTVYESLHLAGGDPTRRDFENRLQEILGVLPVLAKVKDRRAGLLSGGERQALSVGLVLAALGSPKVLLVDEPTASLAPEPARELLVRLAELAERQGTALVLVEQNIRECLGVSSRLVLLRGGKIIAEVPANVATEDSVRERLFST
jgi:branched-chain amino acid transport system ATP-binding protein